MSPTDFEPSDIWFSQFVKTLEPLFELDRETDPERLFQYVCCLVRAGGVQLTDSDPILESTALLDDLRALSVSLDPKTFSHPARTRARLALISYAHVTESDFFYGMLASLAKVKAGGNYDMAPFADLYRNHKGRSIPPPVAAKIRRINELAVYVGVDTQALFEQIYFKDIRNAVFHADYALTDEAFVMRNGGWHTVKAGYRSPAIPLEELSALIVKTFDFYRAIIALHHRARRRLIWFKDRIVPYDWHHKGLIELLFDEDVLAGFRTYWPNGSNSEFRRTRSGSTRATNVTFETDGSMNFMVGLFARRPGTWSPLVEHDGSPVYKAADGRATAPHWPDDHKPYICS